MVLPQPPPLPRARTVIAHAVATGDAHFNIACSCCCNQFSLMVANGTPTPSLSPCARALQRWGGTAAVWARQQGPGQLLNNFVKQPER